MKAQTFDRKFDTGTDLTEHLDLNRARRVGTESGRVNADGSDIQSKIEAGYASAQRGELLDSDEVRRELAKRKQTRPTNPLARMGDIDESRPRSKPPSPETHPSARKNPTQ